MTEIIALQATADGGALVAVWPPRTCLGCHRAAALGVIRLGTSEPRRNEFRCVECDESILPAPSPHDGDTPARVGVSAAGPAVTSGAATAGDAVREQTTREEPKPCR